MSDQDQTQADQSDDSDWPVQDPFDDEVIDYCSCHNCHYRDQMEKATRRHERSLVAIVISLVLVILIRRRRGQ